MADVDLTIGGRLYRVGCRAGEEDSLRKAAELVDGKIAQVISGLGNQSEARQFLFASLLLADQLIDKPRAGSAPPAAPTPDPLLAERADALASRLESLADALEQEASNRADAPEREASPRADALEHEAPEQEASS